MSVHTTKVFRKGPLGATKRNLEERGGSFGWLYEAWCWKMVFCHPFLPYLGSSLHSGPPARAAFLGTILPALYLTTPTIPPCERA